MSRLEQILDESVERQVLPFVVAMVGDRAGVRWQGSAGRANAAHDAGPETVFSLFSMTKAVGSLMAVMAIDRGLITMDTPVADVLPDFERIQVLDGMGPEGPVYRRPKTRATLRHLLTHTAGMGYEAFYPAMADYALKTGSPADVTGKIESLYYPMLFDPGEDFAYGVSTDWVGALVSELDGRSIDRFVREEILQPLGMSSTYFERADAGDRLGDLFLKESDGRFTPFEMYPAANPEIYHMGHALYATAPDYLAFLRFVLNGGELDGQRLVGPEAMKLMYTDQLAGVQLPSPLLKCSVPFVSYDVDPRPETRKTHTAAFFRSEDDLPAMRRAGSLSWAGVLNTHYWIDPASDVAAVFMTQMLPFYDPDVIATYEEFERGVYQEIRR